MRERMFVHAGDGRRCYNGIVEIPNRRKQTMPTVIRPEITEDNPFYISRQRYYELKHFCMQYGEWKIKLRIIDGIQRQAPYTDIPKTETNMPNDPVSKAAEERESLQKRIDIVEKAAEYAGADLHGYILKGITEGLAYPILRLHTNFPCNRNEYYERYRKFFWILDKLRD